MFGSVARGLVRNVRGQAASNIPQFMSGMGVCRPMSVNTDMIRAKLTETGSDPASIKKSYIKLAKDYHPDANSKDKDAVSKFVALGKMYEILMRKEKPKSVLEGEDEEDLDDYGEEEAKTTFSAAAGPILTRQMKRELRRVSEEMASGGARDAGWFAFAKQFGEDDAIKDLPGGPNIAGEKQQITDGRKTRRRKQN